MNINDLEKNSQEYCRLEEFNLFVVKQESIP